jgi:hypothetical protein
VAGIFQRGLKGYRIVSRKRRCVKHFVRFEVLNVMLLKIQAFWDV